MWANSTANQVWFCNLPDCCSWPLPNPYASQTLGSETLKFAARCAMEKLFELKNNIGRGTNGFELTVNKFKQLHYF